MEHYCDICVVKRLCGNKSDYFNCDIYKVQEDFYEMINSLGKINREKLQLFADPYMVGLEKMTNEAEKLIKKLNK